MDPLTIALLSTAGGAVLNKVLNPGGGGGGQYKQRNLLSKSQRPLKEQAIQAGLNPGAGGAYGEAADYYRSNLSNNPEDFEAMKAPEMRRFNEEIVPNLAHQFQASGAGDSGVSGSNFANAAVNAGTDLSERLASMRSQLRERSAQGLMNVGNVGLTPHTQNTYQQNAPGFADYASQAAGEALPGLVSDYFKGQPGTTQQPKAPLNAPQLNTKLNVSFGSTSPYGGQSPGTYGRVR